MTEWLHRHSYYSMKTHSFCLLFFQLPHLSSLLEMSLGLVWSGQVNLFQFGKSRSVYLPFFSFMVIIFRTLIPDMVKFDKIVWALKREREREGVVQHPLITLYYCYTCLGSRPAREIIPGTDFYHGKCCHIFIRDHDTFNTYISF